MNERYNVIIVDDEYLAQKLLQDYVSKVESLQLVATCSNAFEAMEALKNNRVDLAGVKAGLQLRVRDVARDNNGSLKVHARAHGILGKFGAHGIDALVEVDLDALRAFAGPAVFFGYEFGRIDVHLLDPDAFPVYLALDVAVCAAAHAHADWAAGAVAREADYVEK